MASVKVLDKKKAYVAGLVEKLKSSCVGVLVDYKGIDAVDDTVLRRQLRECGSDYFVVKNTLLLRAARLSGLEGLEPLLKGSTAVALSKVDYSLAAKILEEFSRKNDFFSIKAGFVEGKVVGKSEVEALAKLPSKDVLVATLLRDLGAPVTGLAVALNGIMRSLALVLNAVAEKRTA